MDPLSITASVAGILTASVKILGVLTLLHDAPAFVTAIGVEVNHIRIVVAALRKFLDRTRRLPPGRAALIQVDDVVAILTQTVLTFSELEGFVRSAASRSTLLRLRSRISWPWQQAGADRLLNRLQQHKMTLSLVLQIIQCNSDLDAEEFATSLQDQVENQVQGSPDLLKRLEQLEPLPDDIDAKTLSGDLKPTEEQVEDVDTEEEGCPGHASFPQPNFEIIPPSTNIDIGAPALYDISQTVDLMDKSPSLTSQKPSIEMPPSRPITTPGMLPRRFEVILSTTRVYNRVRHRGIDDATSIISFRSRGWSVLTGVSLARVSAISVINLPLSDAEVRRFLDLANSKPKKKNRPPPSDIRLDPRRIPRKLDPPALHSTPKIVQDEAASSRADSGQLRVIRELDGLISNPPKSVFAQEVTDDLMEWQAGITGPPDSPYHGGIWLLRIRFEHAYPRVAPEISFTTRIYHPNVDQNGQISLDMLNQPWSSSINMRQGASSSLPSPCPPPLHHALGSTDNALSVLLRIWLLLYDPQLDIALVPEIAETYTNDRERFDRTAREWTKGFLVLDASLSAFPDLEPSTTAETTVTHFRLQFLHLRFHLPAIFETIPGISCFKGKDRKSSHLVENMKALKLWTISVGVAGVLGCGSHNHDDREWSAEELEELEAKWGTDWSFSGISTFAHLPHVKCLTNPSQEFDIGIIGAPFDTAVSYRPGARFGPRAIRAASARQISFRAYNPRANINPYQSWAKVIDCGDIPVTPFDNAVAVRQMEAAFSELGSRRTASSLLRRPKLLTLGGDHSLALPALRALHAHYGPIRVLHFDAHLDTWSPDKYPSAWASEQSRFTHGSMFWLAGREGLLSNTSSSLHAGLRTRLSGTDAADWDEDSAQGWVRIAADDIDDVGGARGVARAIMDNFGAADPVYLSVDIDVLDPAFAPGTGTPEPGGWTTRELIRILRGIEDLNIVGADVVEVSPAYQNAGEETSLAAAQVIYEILSSVVKRGLKDMASSEAARQVGQEKDEL